MQFLEVLNERPIVGDGAMGTLLYARGVPLDHPVEVINAQRPQIILDIHTSYIEAGAQLIETNTYGGNAERLSHSGHDGQVRDLNEAGARLAREAAKGRDVFVG